MGSKLIWDIYVPLAKHTQQPQIVLRLLSLLDPLFTKFYMKYTKIWNILISKQYFANLNLIVQMPSSGSWRKIEKRKTFNTGTIRLGCLSCMFQKLKCKRSFPPPFQECAPSQGSHAQALNSSSPWSSPRLDSANIKKISIVHTSFKFSFEFVSKSEIFFHYLNPELLYYIHSSWPGKCL